MKRIAAILIMVLMGFLSSAQNCFTTTPELPFRSGEKVKLGLYFRWGAVNTEVAWGELSVEDDILNGAPVYKSKLLAASAPFFSAFYDMHEHFETWFEQDRVRPLKYLRNTKQGDYRATNNYIYDWENHIIHADINFEGRGQQILDIPVQESVCDISSILFLVRSMDFEVLEPGQQIPLAFAIDDTVFDIMLTFVGRDGVKVKRFGWIKTFKFNCSVVSGALFDGKTEMCLWFSDDGNKIPIGFMAPLKIGSVQGWIKNVEGLKYPFEAKLK